MFHTLRPNFLKTRSIREVHTLYFSNKLQQRMAFFECTYCSPRANIQFNLRLYPNVQQRTILNALI